MVNRGKSWDDLRLWPGDLRCLAPRWPSLLVVYRLQPIRPRPRPIGWGWVRLRRSSGCEAWSSVGRDLCHDDRRFLFFSFRVYHAIRSSEVILVALGVTILPPEITRRAVLFGVKFCLREKPLSSPLPSAGLCADPRSRVRLAFVNRRPGPSRSDRTAGQSLDSSDRTRQNL